MRRCKQPKAAIPLALAGAIMLIAGAAVRADETGEKDKATVARPASAGDLGAAKVGKDLGTDALRPLTEQESAILSQELRKALAKGKRQTARTRRDGSKSLVVAPQFLNVSVATVGADGKVSWKCPRSPEQAVKALESAATSSPAPQGPEEK